MCVYLSLSLSHTGDVVAVGGGDSVTLKPGDSVVYSKFGIGVTEIQMQGEDYCIIKENDIIGVMPRWVCCAVAEPFYRARKYTHIYLYELMNECISKERI